jgi:hypothetical protein
LNTASSSQSSTSTSYQPNTLTDTSQLLSPYLRQLHTLSLQRSFKQSPSCKMSRGGTTLYVTVGLTLFLQARQLNSKGIALQDIALLTLSALGLRTRYTRSRPSLRIRTVCQPNVDISMITLECDDLPLPHISSSFLVETSLSTSARILPAFARFTLPLPFLVRSSCRTMIRTLSPHLSRANNANSGGSSFLASCFISCSLHPSSPSTLRSRV